MSAHGSMASNPGKSTAKRRRGPKPPKQDADGVCIFFAQGRCNRGNACKYRHESVQSTADHWNMHAGAYEKDLQTPVAALDPGTIRVKLGPESSRPHSTSTLSPNGQAQPPPSTAVHNPASQPCCSWNGFGTCPKNDDCEYEHDPQVAEDIRCRAKEITAQQEAARKLREEEQLALWAWAAERKAAQKAAAEETARKEAATVETTRIAQQEDIRRLREAEAQIAREAAEAAARLAEQETMARAEATRQARITQQEEARQAQEAVRRAREAQEAAARQAWVAQMEEAQRAREAQQEEARRAREAQQQEARRVREAQQEEARRAREARQEEVRRAREARMIEIAKEEAAVTVQHIVLDFTVVTFNAGLAIHDILTGFESCRIRIKNLPLDATHNEVCGLFTQQGIKPGQFHVVGMNRAPNGKQEAHVIGHEDLKMIAIALDGVDFRQEQLLFEVSQHGAGDGMRASAGDSDVLTLTWRAPAVGFVATYHDTAVAQAKIRELDKKVCLGRRVKAEINRQQGRAAMLPSNEVLIRGFPPTITDEEAYRFAGSTLLRRLKPVNFNITQAPELIRHYINGVAGGQLSRFEDVTTDALGGTYTVRAHFNTWTKAKEVLQRIEKQRFQFIGNNSFCWLRLPDPFQYTITISNQQYGAQKKMWDALLEGAKNNDGHKLSVTGRDRVHIIRLGGEDKKAVGSLKVRVENVAAGGKLDSWHMSVGQKFLDSVFDETGAFLRNDRRLRAFKVYGEPRAVDAARIMVKDEVARLESLEQTVLLKRQSVRFFVMRGLAVMKEELGEDNVTLDVSSFPARIVIKGGESARHVLNRLIEESLDTSNIAVKTGEATCPICYDDVASPIQLGCGHTYCTPCIRHFLTSATSFPLSCMGDEDKCHAPIPIPTIQRFLPPQQFTSLLETAFITHIEHRPQEFKYCTTPDCRQVYCCGKSETASVIHCPSCLSAVCASCHEEGHEGMTCAERKLQDDPAEQERLNDQLARESGFKKCPQCTVWIEKTEGCNHMACRCGAHICWVCLGVFNANSVYDHMQTAHGTIYGAVGEAVEAQDLAEQREVLRLAGIRREQLRLREAQAARPPNYLDMYLHVDRRQEEARQEQLRLEEYRRAQRQNTLRMQREQEELRRQEQLRQEVQRREEWQRQTERFARIRLEEQRRQEIRKEQGSGWGCVVM